MARPERVVLFTSAAIQEPRARTKAIKPFLFARAPRLSYWNGCSTGGRQGLEEAQRYPDDFDAIVAGAPANYQTHLHAWDLGVAVPVLKHPARVVPAAKLTLLNKAAISACDAQDSVKDG